MLCNTLSLLKANSGLVYVAGDGVTAAGAVIVGVNVGWAGSVEVSVETAVDDGASLGVIVSDAVGDNGFDAVMVGVDVFR